MNKSELVREVSTKLNTTLKDTGAFLDCLLETITEELVKGESVKLTGFGVFGTTEAAPRVGRNLHTNEVINIPAKTKVYCKMSQVLKKSINEDATE